MPQIDYTGAHGGQLAMAFAAGFSLASTFAAAAGAAVWNWLQGERAKDEAKCKEDLDRLQLRIVQLETLLIAHGPQPIRRELEVARLEQLRSEDTGG